MTEDDTFSALKRVSFDQMEEFWGSRIDLVWGDPETVEFFKSHGWDPEEHKLEFLKRHNLIG